MIFWIFQRVCLFCFSFVQRFLLTHPFLSHSRGRSNDHGNRSFHVPSHCFRSVSGKPLLWQRPTSVTYTALFTNTVSKHFVSKPLKTSWTWSTMVRPFVLVLFIDPSSWLSVSEQWIPKSPTVCLETLSDWSKWSPTWWETRSKWETPFGLVYSIGLLSFCSSSSSSL